MVNWSILISISLSVLHVMSGPLIVDEAMNRRRNGSLFDAVTCDDHILQGHETAIWQNYNQQGLNGFKIE